MSDLVAQRTKKVRRQVDDVELEFLEGLLVPWYWLLAKELLFLYVYRRDQIDRAWQALPQVLRQLQQLRVKDPALFDRLVKQTLSEGFQNVPDAIDGPLLAFTAGRLVRARIAHQEDSLQVQLGGYIEVLIAVTLIYLPFLLVDGLQEAAARALAQVPGDAMAELLKAIQDQAQALAPVLRRLNGGSAGGMK